MTDYDAFISFAFEDSALASEIAGGLKSHGFKVWYADFVLKIGDKLLDAIEQGLKQSKFGILLISKPYLKKGWTNYEMDTLIRQSIEKNKKLLPIWHEVTKEEVEDRHTGLGGTYALRSDIGLHNLISKLTEVMAEGYPNRVVIPSYESPKFRFLQGRGEFLFRTANGPAFTLWEAILHFPDNTYPVVIGEELFSKRDFLFYAAQALAADKSIAIPAVGEKGIKEIWDMCVKEGLDPRMFA